MIAGIEEDDRHIVSLAVESQPRRVPVSFRGGGGGEVGRAASGSRSQSSASFNPYLSHTMEKPLVKYAHAAAWLRNPTLSSYHGYVALSSTLAHRVRSHCVS